MRSHGAGTIQLRRAYDPPSGDDGFRVLVDRVWPRGRTRQSLQLDQWAPNLGPSHALRRWFGHDPTRWPDFQSRYRAELAESEQSALLDELAQRAHSTTVTLVYGARDEEHNQARVLADEIAQRLGRGAE
jgi:uncharacterized protein YeaO (DUF488 family)